MKKLILKYHFWVLGILGMALSSCSTTQRVLAENGSKKIYNHKYGEHKKHVMDVFLPQNYSEDSPLVMIVHGGAWKLGRKEHMKMIQRRLFKENIPTVNINYRLVRTKKGITYQQQLEDIALAVNETRKQSRDWKLNPDNLVLLGESAGGHLALLYGYSNPDKVSKLISMSGPTDFYSEDFTSTLNSKYTSPTIEDVVGTKFIRENISEEFRKASPLANVSNVPTLIFQGDLDHLVNKNQGLALASKLELEKIPHKLVFMKNTGHTPRFFSKKKRDSLIFPNIIQFISEDFK